MQESLRYGVGLDIGTTHVRCVIGHFDCANQSATIVGVGESQNAGMRKGVVVNITGTAHAIDKALDEAERMSGHHVEGVSVNVNGSHIMAMSSKGVVAVNSQNHEIAEEDIARAQDAATVLQLPANREILQVTARSYELDGQENIKDPLGMSGIRLEVDAHVITAFSPNVKNLSKSLEMTQTGVHQVMVAGLASAKAVLTPQQMENGVAVVDFGGTTTSIVVYEEGDLQHVAVLPLGSVNITNDLAIGLRTDLDIAEMIKIEHASAIALGKNAPKTVECKRGEEKFEFSRKDVEMVVDARLDEIFELVDKELASIDRSGKLPGGIVLTGGGANLKNLTYFVKEKLRLPVRVANFSGFSGMNDKIAKPEFAAALGLMLADLETTDVTVAKNKIRNATKSKEKTQQFGKLFKQASNLLERFKT